MPASRKKNTDEEPKPRPSTPKAYSETDYEKTHGKIVKNRDLAREGMRLVLAVYQGKMTFAEYEKHWEKLCASYR